MDEINTMDELELTARTLKIKADFTSQNDFTPQVI